VTKAERKNHSLGDIGEGRGNSWKLNDGESQRGVNWERLGKNKAESLPLKKNCGSWEDQRADKGKI